MSYFFFPIYGVTRLFHQLIELWVPYECLNVPNIQNGTELYRKYSCYALYAVYAKNVQI